MIKLLTIAGLAAAIAAPAFAQTVPSNGLVITVPVFVQTVPPPGGVIGAGPSRTRCARHINRSRSGFTEHGPEVARHPEWPLIFAPIRIG